MYSPRLQAKVIGYFLNHWLKVEVPVGDMDNEDSIRVQFAQEDRDRFNSQ